MPASAAPASSQNRQMSVLREFQLDPSLVKDLSTPVHFTGVVTVDRTEKRVTLSVNQAPSCPAGAMCPQYLVQILDVELPIVSIMTDGCHNRIIVAREDRRPVDGALQSIMITDHSTSTCDIYLKYATDVQYTSSFVSRSNGGEAKSLSHFQGDLLKVLH